MQAEACSNHGLSETGGTGEYKVAAGVQLDNEGSILVNDEYTGAAAKTAETAIYGPAGFLGYTCCLAHKCTGKGCSAARGR